MPLTASADPAELLPWQKHFLKMVPDDCRSKSLDKVSCIMKSDGNICLLVILGCWLLESDANARIYLFRYLGHNCMDHKSIPWGRQRWLLLFHRCTVHAILTVIMVMRMMTLTVMAISVFFLGHSGKHCSGKNKLNEVQMSWLFFLFVIWPRSTNIRIFTQIEKS